MEKNHKLIVAALVVLFGSNAGSFINTINPNIRSDPFTGADGIALEDRIDILELEVARCRQRNAMHRESQASSLATLNANVQNNKDLISRCLRITGQ